MSDKSISVIAAAVLSKAIDDVASGCKDLLVEAVKREYAVFVVLPQTSTELQQRGQEVLAEGVPDDTAVVSSEIDVFVADPLLAMEGMEIASDVWGAVRRARQNRNAVVFALTKDGQFRVRVFALAALAKRTDIN